MYYWVTGFVCLSLAWCCVLSQTLSNHTIDDTFGDLLTSTGPIYVLSNVGVWKDAGCGDCAIISDTSEAFKGAWTLATYNRDRNSFASFLILPLNVSSK